MVLIVIFALWLLSGMVLIVVFAKVDNIKMIGFVFELFFVAFKLVLFVRGLVVMRVLVLGHFIVFTASF